MILTFLGADHEVTGSCHYLQVGDKKAVVDCGMEQGKDIYVNQELPVPAGDIDYIFLTHAHIDHSGLIPLMVKKGFATVCCETVRIFRSLKHSGRTGRQKEQDVRSMFLFIIRKMQRPLAS